MSRGLAYNTKYALNAICPYFTMFPLEFPFKVLKKHIRANPVVLDPFCGRGTTVYAAREMGFSSWGFDTSPIAVAVAKAKLASSSKEGVIKLAKKLIATEAQEIPIEAFKSRYNLLVKENEIREVQNSEIYNLRKLLECAILKNNNLGLGVASPINISIQNSNQQSIEINYSKLLEEFEDTSTVFKQLPGFNKEDEILLEEIKELLVKSKINGELTLLSIKPKLKAFYKRALDVIGDAKKIFIDAPQLYHLLKNATLGIYDSMTKIDGHNMLIELKQFLIFLNQMF